MFVRPATFYSVKNEAETWEKCSKLQAQRGGKIPEENFTFQIAKVLKSEKKVVFSMEASRNLSVRSQWS